MTIEMKRVESKNKLLKRENGTGRHFTHKKIDNYTQNVNDYNSTNDNAITVVNEEQTDNHHLF